MRKLVLLAVVSISACNIFGQTQSIDDAKRIVNAYLTGQQLTGKDSVVHMDATYSFEIGVPDWWHILETSPGVFGGTFPAIDDIENALVLKCYQKSKFKDLDDFEHWVVKDYSMGQKPKWSTNHTMLLKKQLDDFKELGPAYKVQLMVGSKIYDCCYIVTETATGFIWIDFTATNATYPKNFDKFKGIVNSFKKL